MSLDPTVLKQLSLFATGFSVAFLAALWLSLIFWAFRDIRKRIYLILRPQRTLEEEYQQSLEEEALLQTIEDASICPGCNRRIESSWLACPNCHSLLKKQCKTCGKVIALPWNLCPYCATPVEGTQKDQTNPSDAEQLSLDDDFLSQS
jgi:RNA polymerase subunit RPABC4/transcription elongation factor Spt4